MTINPIIQYNKEIQSGKILTSKKVKRIYKYLADLITGKFESNYYYDENRSRHAIEFIERYCKQSKSKWANKNLKLELWQKALVSAIFGIINKETGFRKYKEVLLIVGKKNGKSVLASAIALYMLIGDGEGGAECYSVATKRDQAKIIWQEAFNMVQKSPELKKRIKCLTNKLVYKKNNSVFKPLSSDSNTEDGLNISNAELDEIHAWKNNDLFNIIYDGISARDEPLILMTTTAGFVRGGAYDKKYNEAKDIINSLNDNNSAFRQSFLPVIYELDDSSEWTDETKWIKANPNLGVSKGYDYLREQVLKAKANPYDRNNILTKEFNLPQTSESVWLDFDDLDNDLTFDLKELKPAYGIGGADLSSTTDLTSACVLFQVPDNDMLYFLSMYWLPYEGFEKRIKEDDVPYNIWHDLGYLRLCSGNKVDYDDVVSWFSEIQNEYGIYINMHGYDAWSAQAYIKKMNDTFGEVGIPVRQGKLTLSNPMKVLGAEIKSKRVNYNNNPITKWCLSNVMANIDKNENIQPAKVSRTRRIDGFAAMLDAFVVYYNEKDSYLNLIKY